MVTVVHLWSSLSVRINDCWVFYHQLYIVILASSFVLYVCLTIQATFRSLKTVYIRKWMKRVWSLYFKLFDKGFKVVTLVSLNVRLSVRYLLTRHLDFRMKSNLRTLKTKLKCWWLKSNDHPRAFLQHNSRRNHCRSVYPRDWSQSQQSRWFMCRQM